MKGALIFVFLSPVVSSLPMTKFIIISASESGAAFRIYNHQWFLQPGPGRARFPLALLQRYCNWSQSLKSACRSDCLYARSACTRTHTATVRCCMKSSGVSLGFTYSHLNNVTKGLHTCTWQTFALARSRLPPSCSVSPLSVVVRFVECMSNSARSGIYAGGHLDARNRSA